MTKAQVVTAALNEIGISENEFDVSPEQIATDVQRLNLMISHWSDSGLLLGYDIGAGINDESGIPDVAQEAVVTNLAVRLAPSYGKQVAQDVRSLAVRSYRNLLRYAMYPRERQLPSMPKGAGYKAVDPFTHGPKEKYLEDNDSRIGL